MKNSPAVRTGSKKVARRVRALENRRRVWELRSDGHPVRAIAAMLAAEGRRLSVTQVYRIIALEIAALKQETRESVDQVRSVELARIRHKQAQLAPKCAEGNPTAVRAWAILEALVVKVTGIAAPDRIEVSTADRFRALTDEQLETELKRGAAALGLSLQGDVFGGKPC